MIFPYRRYPLKGPVPGFPKAEIYRPRIPVILMGPTGEVGFEALVDTGSDQTIFPLIHIEPTGIKINKGARSPTRGLAEIEKEFTLGDNVELGLRIEGEVFQWPATVWFGDLKGGPAILGRSGFLEYFKAMFDGEKRELELKPTKAFPGVVTDLWE